MSFYMFFIDAFLSVWKGNKKCLLCARHIFPGEAQSSPLETWNNQSVTNTYLYDGLYITLKGVGVNNMSIHPSFH